MAGLAVREYSAMEHSGPAALELGVHRDGPGLGLQAWTSCNDCPRLRPFSFCVWGTFFLLCVQYRREQRLECCALSLTLGCG